MYTGVWNEAKNRLHSIKKKKERRRRRTRGEWEQKRKRMVYTYICMFGDSFITARHACRAQCRDYVELHTFNAILIHLNRVIPFFTKVHRRSECILLCRLCTLWLCLCVSLVLFTLHSSFPVTVPHKHNFPCELCRFVCLCLFPCLYPRKRRFVYHTGVSLHLPHANQHLCDAVDALVCVHRAKCRVNSWLFTYFSSSWVLDSISRTTAITYTDSLEWTCFVTHFFFLSFSLSISSFSKFLFPILLKNKLLAERQEKRAQKIDQINFDQIKRRERPLGECDGQARRAIAQSNTRTRARTYLYALTE